MRKERPVRCYLMSTLPLPQAQEPELSSQAMAQTLEAEFG